MGSIHQRARELLPPGGGQEGERGIVNRQGAPVQGGERRHERPVQDGLQRRHEDQEDERYQGLLSGLPSQDEKRDTREAQHPEEDTGRDERRLEG